MNSEKTILVVTSDTDDQMRGSGLLPLGADAIAAELNSMCSVLEEAFGKVSRAAGDYALSEVSVKVELTASGKLALLGSGVSASGTGGITLKFTKVQAVS